MIAFGADSYLWTPTDGLNTTSSDTVTASPAATTIYTVTGTLLNGCSSAASATVSVVPYPLVNAGSDTLVCNNTAAIQLTGSPSGGAWSGNAFITSSGIFNPVAAGNGTYTVFYSAANGSCAATDSTVVTVIDPPVANAGNDTLVCQSNVALNLSGLPAGGSWSGSSVTQYGLFTPSIPGSYQLIYTVGSGSCIDADTVIITVSAGITNNIISSDQSICTATQPSIIVGQIAAGGNGESAYQWQLSTDSVNWTIIPSEISKDYTSGVLTQTTWFRRIASTTLCSGPEASFSLPVKITVNPNAVAQFNPVTIKGCAPFSITPAVINLTLDNSVSEYRWFVNGSYIGSGQNFPGYTINNSGDSVTVKLVAVSAFGCKNDSTQHGFSTVATPVPSFLLSDSTGCGPLTIAVTNTTADFLNYSYEWNFGQGQTSSSSQPGNIIFPVNPNFGDTVYTVLMKTISACDTINTLHQVIVRAHPQVLFTPDKTAGCSPMHITFTNTSRGSNANYTWNFDDGTPLLPTGNATVQHTFNTGEVRTYHVKLNGINDCGTDSLIYAIVVSPNTIRIDFAVNGNERFGCTPHTVHFINNTTGASNFTWNFGDGTTLNTTKGIDTVVHTFTSAGNFAVNLLAANSCSDTTDTEPVTVQLKPVVSFSPAASVSCITDSIRFNNTSDAGISNLWNFGDGTGSAVRDPAKAYAAPGTYHVTLVGSRSFSDGLSCSDSSFAAIIIRDTLPGSFSVSDSIGSCIPFSVTFKNDNSPSTKTAWSFGDGSIADGDNVTHTFTAPGIYTVTMSSHGSSGCTFKATKTIRVTAPAGNLLYTGGFVCPGNSVRFETRATDASQYKFVFGDGDSVTTSNSIVFHDYVKPGSYVPYAYLIQGNCGIKVLTGDSVKADKIAAGFTIAPQFNCGTTNVQFADTSYAYFGLQSWQWNFGDGTSSALQNPAKTYSQSAANNVQLSVTGVSGCTNTVTVPLNVHVRNFPVAAISSDNTACTHQPVTMSALAVSQDTLSSYRWNFGNNTTATGINVKSVYNTSGNYTVRLIVTTIYGCADTVYKAIVVNESPAVNAGADARICKGQSVQLQAFGTSSWQWSPLQNLSCTTCSNPVADPSSSTFYIAKGTNSFGCSVSDTVLVEVVQPVTLTISANDSICIGNKTQLFAGGAPQYFWSPPAGLSSTSAPNPVAQPIVTTQYQVIGKDAFNCFADTALVTVAVGQYPVVNLGTGSLVVAGTQVTMNPVTTNGPFKNYMWTPVTDLSCSDCPRPVAVINTNISYKLEAENIYGCKGSDTINYTVTCEEAAQLYVPNAFSPDGDGLNDVLMVRGKGLASVKYFRIFNRWGQLVFERNNVSANDATQGWDGKVSGKPANPDVYVYTVEVVCTGGSVFIKKGNVTLFR